MTDLLARLAQAPARASQASSDFDLNTSDGPRPSTLTPAAVLIAVTDQAEVILTRRSTRLKHHPGQIALPGGRQDPDDATLADTALREASEEIGLPPGAAKVLGALPCHDTVSHYQVTPILARVGDFAPRLEQAEVSELFRVPLAHLVQPAHYRIEGRMWRGARRYYYTVPWGPYYIWGATARMLRSLAEAMA